MKKNNKYLSDPLDNENLVNENSLKKETKRKRTKKHNTIVRIGEIEARAAETRRIEIDAHEVESMYIPWRRVRLLAKSILRLDKMRLFLLISVVVITTLFILSFMQEKMGNFTINLDRLELYRKGIAMSADSEFTDPTARLTAETVEDATNISIKDLPNNLDSAEGQHNGRNYLAYTYYVRNAGIEDVNYVVSLKLDKSAKGAERAVRVAVWRNGVRTVYALPARDGKPEEDCVNFATKDTAFKYIVKNFRVGYVDKYTVAIWMEGDDPECIDDIVGGSVEFSMDLQAEEQNKKNLLQMFWQDLTAWITKKDSINPAGVEAPNYYKDKNLTWETRRNLETDDTEVVNYIDNAIETKTNGYVEPNAKDSQ